MAVKIENSSGIIVAEVNHKEKAICLNRRVKTFYAKEITEILQTLGFTVTEGWLQNDGS
jgi:hypothetical protein